MKVINWIMAHPWRTALLVVVIVLPAYIVAINLVNSVDTRGFASVCEPGQDAAVEAEASPAQPSPSESASAIGVSEAPDPTEKTDETPTDEPTDTGLVDGAADDRGQADTTKAAEIHFGRDRSLRGDQVLFQPPADLTLTPGAALGIDKEVLRRDEVPGSIAARKPLYFATARVTGSGRVRLKVCVDAANQRIDPGTYRGNIAIVHDGRAIAIVPVLVTVQLADWGIWVFLFALVILVGGPFFVWASGRKPVFLIKDPKRKSPTWQEVRDTLKELYLRWLPFTNFMGLFVGIFAAFSAFIASYWSNPAWGAKAPNDWVTLLAAMFTAFTTGLAAGSATSDPPSDFGDKEPAAPTTPTTTPPQPPPGG